MEKFSACKILLISILFSLGERRVARGLDDKLYREMDVRVAWPELEANVTLERGQYFSFVRVTEQQMPCAHSHMWSSSALFGIIATGNRPSNLHIPTTEIVYAITCPSEEEGANRKLNENFIPTEFELRKLTARKRNKVIQQYGKATYEVNSERMEGIGTILNALIPNMHTNRVEKIKLDTVWEVIIKELFHLDRVSALKPTNTVLGAYNNLPDLYDGNEVVYSGFFNQFGTDCTIKVALGGIYSFKHRLNSAGDLVNNNYGNSVDKTNGTQSFVWDTVSIGGSNAKSAEEWEDTVIDAPSPLWYATHPLTQILDPANQNPVKVESFHKGRSVEQSYFKFKMDAENLLFFLPSRGNKLQRFFREILTRQLGYIKPNSGLIETLQQELDNNPQLDKYSVICQSPGSLRDDVFYIIVGPCISFPQTPCDIVISNVQGPRLKFDYFSKPNCEGEAVRNNASTWYKMPGEEFETYRSVRLVSA